MSSARPLSPDAAGELDSLPPELLNLFLSRLPLRDAVGTSAPPLGVRPLARVQMGRGADPGAITGVLRRYSYPFREFHHPHVGEASFRHSDLWIRLICAQGGPAPLA
ncbi:hypothetical protein ACP70R_014839 [Stipagrostis hirtigluma subsp. patula]